jgi:putative membrane protein
LLRLAALFALLGLAAVTGLIIWSGASQVLAALAAAGWGILLTSLYHLVSMACCITGWRALMPGRTRPSRGFFLYVLWLRTSVNNLMPVARIGGEILAVRLMTKRGVRRTIAVASTVIELTLSVIAVFLFIALGLWLLTARVAEHAMIWKLVMGLLLSAPMILVMLAVQRAGLFGLLDKIFALMFRGRWKALGIDMQRLDRAVHLMYRRKLRVLICFFWQLAGWFAGIGEVWLGLYFLGHPLSLIECFMIEALVQATASAGFAIPAALGIQEGSFVLSGGLLGLPPEIAVALAMIRRCRDLILFVPGLIAWQIEEGHGFLRHLKTAK